MARPDVLGGIVVDSLSSQLLLFSLVASQSAKAPSKFLDLLDRLKYTGMSILLKPFVTTGLKSCPSFL